MIVLISGSRDGFTYEEFVDEFSKLGSVDKAIFGCARGIDSFAERFCTENKIPYEKFYANWDGLGKSAGKIRNIEMGDKLSSYRDMSLDCTLFAMRYDESDGTSHMIKYVAKLGIKSIVIDKDSIDFEFD